MDAGEALGFYRNLDRDHPETAYALIRDPLARRIVAAWRTYPVRWTPPAGAAPDYPDTWRWLWKGIRVDCAALAERAGVPVAILAWKFPMLRGQRILYPDGTISEHARSVLEAEIERARGGDAAPEPVDPGLHARDITSDANR